jgi:hypothetical protein
MAYLTYVGPDTYRGGSASRGYSVFRRGKRVTVRFGAIRVERHRSIEFKWMYDLPHEYLIRCSSTQAAAKMVKQIIREKTHQRHKYLVLAKGKKIS